MDTAGIDGPVLRVIPSHPRFLLRHHLLRFLEELPPDRQVGPPCCGSYPREWSSSYWCSDGSPIDSPGIPGTGSSPSAERSPFCSSVRRRRRPPSPSASRSSSRGSCSRCTGRSLSGEVSASWPPTGGSSWEGRIASVRHPIYLGYLVTHVGFLLANWSSRNIAIYIVEYFFQVARILSEERLLKEDDGYRVYFERVRYRLIPGVF